MNQNPNTECCEFEMAVSAMLDGELSAAEKDELSERLMTCEACRQTVRDFEAVNRNLQAVYQFGSPSLADRRPTPRPVGRLGRYLFGSSLAVATACVLFFVLWKPIPSQPSNLMTAQQVMQPFEELHQCSLAQERDQSLQIKTLELELRHLQLEIGQIQDQDIRQIMEFRLDLMFTELNDQKSMQ